MALCGPSGDAGPLRRDQATFATAEFESLKLSGALSFAGLVVPGSLVSSWRASGTLRDEDGGSSYGCVVWREETLLSARGVLEGKVKFWVR